MAEDMHILTRMELGATLTNDDVTGHDGLVYNEASITTGVYHLSNEPENFLTPSRLPGEPP
jgi:hypothetical protein